MTTGPYRVDEVEDAGDASCHCDGCDWRGKASETTEIDNCSLTPGDASPVGRCPECDSLAYLEEPIRADKAKQSAGSIFKYLDLVSNHVSQETMEWMGEARPTELRSSGITIAPYEYGAFVSVPGELEGIDVLVCPDDLKVVLRYAREIECDVIRFDGDASELDGLQLFDW